MATTIDKSVSHLQLKTLLILDEAESNALYSIVRYGFNPFKDWFYRNLGKHYMNKHEAGLKSLFDTIGKELPVHIKKIEDARSLLEKHYKPKPNYGAMVNPDEMYPVIYTIDQSGNKVFSSGIVPGKDLTEPQIKHLHEIGYFKIKPDHTK